MAQPTIERWLPVVGYEGCYEVSDYGKVRSIDRDVLGSDGVTQKRRGRTLVGYVKSSGHIQVGLRSGRKVQDKRYVHRLVMEAFVGPCPDGMEVCHSDGVPSNNEITNLRYGTVSDNRYDSVRHGTHVEARKTHCPRNHPLQVPNLVPSLVKIGSRSCLACSRAGARVRRDPSLTPIHTQIADSYYMDILESAK